MTLLMVFFDMPPWWLRSWSQRISGLAPA